MQLSPIDDGGRLQLFLSTAASLAVSLQHVVEFAKRLPGFLALPSTKQLHLVKTNSLKLVLLFDLLLAAPSSSTSAESSLLSQPSLMTFLDGRYLSGPQAEALFSRNFVDSYRRLRERCAAVGLDQPAVALLAAGLLLEPPVDSQADAATQSLQERVATATAAVISSPDLEVVRSLVLATLTTAANEMLEFFQIFQSFCDSRQLPPVFVEVFDF